MAKKVRIVKKTKVTTSKVTKPKTTLDIWKIATFALAVLFIVSIATSGFRGSKGATTETSKGIGAEAAAKEVVNYVNDLLAGTGSTANVVSTETKNDLYNIKIDVGGRVLDAYVTKDAKLFFPTVIDLTQPVGEQQEEQEPTTYPKKDKPEVLMFVMSYCPYGQQAENILHPVAQLLGKNSPIEPHFVIYGNYGGDASQFCLDEEKKYCSMHGIKELNEDVRQLCIWKYYNMRWWDYVLMINSECSLDTIETCWKGIAEKFQIDTAKIEDCLKNEAKDLLAKEVELGQKYEVRGSPTVIINGAQYSGARASESFKEAICSAFTTPPAQCEQKIQSTTPTTAPTAGGCG